jgi:hypothetical protein
MGPVPPEAAVFAAIERINRAWLDGRPESRAIWGTMLDLAEGPA